MSGVTLERIRNIRAVFHAQKQGEKAADARNIKTDKGKTTERIDGAVAPVIAHKVLTNKSFVLHYGRWRCQYDKV